MRGPGQEQRRSAPPRGDRARTTIGREIPLALLFLASAACSACSGTRAPDDHGPLNPATLTRVVVSPTGDDDAIGDDARPLRTLGKALSVASATTIAVLPGTYAESLTIARDVAIEARERATLDGRLTVSIAAVAITGLDVTGGVVADRSPRLALTGLRVGSSSAADALLFTAAIGQLRDVTVTCGVETCIQATSSTVTADGLTFAAGPVPHKRGLRAETSSVTLRGLRAGGATNIDVQASLRSHLSLADAELTDIAGNAIAALGGSTLWVARARIAGTSRVAILLSASNATLAGLDVGPLSGSATGLGIEGGVIRVSDSRFNRAGSSAVVINDHRTVAADVRLDRVTIDHARANGINLGQGKLALADVRLLGDPSADGADALTTSGDTADLVVESATIDGAAGHAIGVYNNAGARITARITRARLGGILIEESAGAELAVRNTQISECAQGSGVAVVNALGVEITDLEVSRCPEAGVLGGAGAELSVRRAKLLDNRQYGVAAFGRSQITLADTTARGSKWAAFASCGDGSAISDGGGNTLTGSTSLCP